MDIEQYSARLSANAAAIGQLLDNVTQEQARWKPTATEWSLLEVVNHLYDEERNDFRMRLELTLRDPTRSWPPNEPEDWVIERGYNQRDFRESLGNFRAERQQSLAWLATLANPDWNTAHTNSYGTLRAGDLLVAWAAHDLLHLRQIIELRWSYEAAQAAPFSVDYAGEW